MMLIGYKMMHKEMMDMVTMVVHQVEVILEVKVLVVCLEEDEARLSSITVIRMAMYLENDRTQLRHVDIAKQSIMLLSNAHS